MAAKKGKVVPLPAKEKQEPQPETTEAESLLGRGRTEICDHITAGGNLDERGDLYEATMALVKQVRALFLSVYMIVENAAGPFPCHEEVMYLCDLGQDLAEEVGQHVDRLH